MKKVLSFVGILLCLSVAFTASSQCYTQKTQSNSELAIFDSSAVGQTFTSECDGSFKYITLKCYPQSNKRFTGIVKIYANDSATGPLYGSYTFDTTYNNYGDLVIRIPDAGDNVSTGVVYTLVVISTNRNTPFIKYNFSNNRTTGKMWYSSILGTYMQLPKQDLYYIVTVQ